MLCTAGHLAGGKTHKQEQLPLPPGWAFKMRATAAAPSSPSRLSNNLHAVNHGEARGATSMRRTSGGAGTVVHADDNECKVQHGSMLSQSSLTTAS